MIKIKLPTGDEAIINDGVWIVPTNEEFARVLNSVPMQPPEDGHYAPTPDARMAMYVMKVWGAEWVSSDEQHPAGKLY